MLFRGSSALAPNPNHDVRLDVLSAEDDGDAGEDADASSIFVLYTLYTPRFPLYSSGTGHDESELDVSVARARSYAARPPSHGGGASGAGLDGAEPMVRAEMRRRVRGPARDGWKVQSEWCTFFLIDENTRAM